MEDSRRGFIKKGASIAAALTVGATGTFAAPVKHNVLALNKVKWPILEGPDTPKLTLHCALNAKVEQLRMTKQIGADYVHMSGPAELPWTERGLREIMDRFKTEGLTVINMMINGFPKTLFGLEGRDEEIENVKASLIAAGKVGLPVVEYNFYAHRLGEGYYNIPGRGGVDYLAYDYNRVNPTTGIAPKDLPPLPGESAHTKEELWANITYFLKAVIPVAEKAGVRMALHPNDPPAPISRGSEQIMSTFKDWKHLFDIVDSPSNGMTFDCGVSTEIGEDPLEVLRYMAGRDRINHMHYRNCLVEIPSTKYTEVFPDNGQVNMFAVMQELVRHKYRFGIFPEHPRVLDYDKALHDGDFEGYLYNLAYARGMFQAAMELEQEGHK
jgi:mannonate dehydratase